MTSEARLRESTVLRNLQIASEARGERFYVRPPRDVLPDFLGTYQPDAIAVGPAGGTIIQVTPRQDPEAERQLIAVAQKVAGQKGWELRVVYLSPPADETPPIEQPTREQLLAAFQEIEELAAEHHTAAALVTGWAALESLARLASAKSGLKGPDELSPVQAVQRLAEEGYLENEDADRLRAMVKLRNAVVHGDFSTAVPTELVADLLKQLRAVETDIAGVLGLALT